MVEHININVWTSVILFLYGLYSIIFKNLIKKRAKAGWLDYYLHRNWPDKAFYIIGMACITAGVLFLVVSDTIILICIILILLTVFFGMSYYYNNKAKKQEKKKGSKKTITHNKALLATPL